MTLHYKSLPDIYGTTTDLSPTSNLLEKCYKTHDVDAFPCRSPLKGPEGTSIIGSGVSVY